MLVQALILLFHRAVNLIQKCIKRKATVNMLKLKLILWIGDKGEKSV
jgi:hypothetical protein